MNPNPVLLTDAYKIDHRRQYPKGTEGVYSNWTPRSSRNPKVNSVVFLGLQYFLKKYLMDEWDAGFFALPADIVCDRYQTRINSYLGPNTIGVEHIRALHKLGYLPLEFRALPEGTHVPLRVPMFTVESTKPEFFWLTNYIETLLSCVVWMPCTSATTAWQYRKLLLEYAKLTGSPLDFVDFQGHDFSFRGMAGPEAASLSGIGHLVSFKGTDTVPAIELIERYYSLGLPSSYFIGGSVAATEHSVMCAGGKESELDTIVRMLDLYPEGIVSIVSDTWDLWNVLTNILPKLKDRILSRPGKTVLRPDSGDPVAILTGAGPTEARNSNHVKGVIQCLWEVFGGTESSTGHRILNANVGCIYGDAITLDRAEQILQRLHNKQFASCNVVFGIGSYTYQHTTRDQYGFAMKATWAKINGVGYELFKDPVTDDGVKKSAKGRLMVVQQDGELVLKDQVTVEQSNGDDNLLVPVWKNGSFVDGRELTFAQVRANSERGLVANTTQKLDLHALAGAGL